MTDNLYVCFILEYSPDKPGRSGFLCRGENGVIATDDLDAAICGARWALLKEEYETTLIMLLRADGPPRAIRLIGELPDSDLHVSGRLAVVIEQAEHEAAWEIKEYGTTTLYPEEA